MSGSSPDGIDAALGDFTDDKAALRKKPPRSSGREDFTESWLEQRLAACEGELRDADVQATLSEFTVRCAADAIAHHGDNAKEVFVCGAGARLLGGVWRA